MELFNLGQKIIVKFTKLSKIGFSEEKLSKIGFSKECITANFSRFSCKNVKPCLLGCRLGTCHQIQAFQEFSWNFLTSEDTLS